MHGRGAYVAGGACGRGSMHDRGRAWQERRQLQWTVRILLECILACGSFCIVTVFINLKGRIKGKISWSKEFYLRASFGVFIVSKMANNLLNLNIMGIWLSYTSLFLVVRPWQLTYVLSTHPRRRT